MIKKCVLVNTLYSCPILMNIEFNPSFAKNTQTSNFMNILAVGTEFFFHADRRTDMTKPIATFRSFANAPKNATLETSQLRTTEHITYCSDAKHCCLLLVP